MKVSKDFLKASGRSEPIVWTMRWAGEGIKRRPMIIDQHGNEIEGLISFNPINFPPGQGRVTLELSCVEIVDER